MPQQSKNGYVIVLFATKGFEWSITLGSVTNKQRTEIYFCIYFYLQTAFLYISTKVLYLRFVNFFVSLLYALVTV